MIPLVLGISALLFLGYKTFSFTPPIPGGIAEIRRIRIGDTCQYASIRGEDLDNPILLYLHSGPGSTEMIPFRQSQKNLEKYFTVVVWEQRGTGKSYSSDIPAGAMTIGQMVSDGHEITRYLKTEFQKEKILLAGHSWGTALGLLLAAAYPEDYYAYVGSGQVTVPAQGERLSCQYVMEKAEGNETAETELVPIGTPDPYLTIDEDGDWYEKIKTERKWLVKFGGESYRRSDNALLFNVGTVLAPEYSIMDFIRFGKGSEFSLRSLWPQVMELDMTRDITVLEIPAFFLQGIHDHNTPAPLVEKYVRGLDAPLKELIWFTESAHHPMYEEPAKYEQVLVEKIRPLCK